MHTVKLTLTTCIELILSLCGAEDKTQVLAHITYVLYPELTLSPYLLLIVSLCNSKSPLLFISYTRTICMNRHAQHELWIFKV